MPQTLFLLLMVLPSLVLAQSSVDELRGASDKAQEVRDRTQPPPPAALPTDSVYDLASVAEIPQYPGGEPAMYDYLRKNMKYPAEAMEAGIQGKVYVEFIIAEDGSVRNVRSLRMPESAISKEAVRVVSNMPKWSPGRSSGKSVKVKYILPINFKLPDPSPPKRD